MNLLGTKIRKIAGVILAIIFAAAVLHVITSIIATFVLFLNEPFFLKADLDNPYMDNQYSGWKHTEIDSVGSFLIPEEWKFTYEDEHIVIAGAQGETIGIGAIVHPEDTTYQTKQDFLSAVFGVDVDIQTTQKYATFVPIKGSFFGTIATPDEKESYSYFSIDGDEKKQFVIAFLPAADKNEQALSEIAQAISYSYSYPESCN